MDTLTSSSIKISFEDDKSTISFEPVPEVIDIGLFEALRGPEGPASEGEKYIASTNISGHKVLAVDSSLEAILADCTNIGHFNAIAGISDSATMIGNYVYPKTSGHLSLIGWSLIPGNTVYLGENGTIVQTIPVSALFVKVLGVAVSSDTILINIQQSIRLS